MLGTLISPSKPGIPLILNLFKKALLINNVFPRLEQCSDFVLHLQHSPLSEAGTIADPRCVTSVDSWILLAR